MTDAETYQTPKLVAHQLKVSASGLRRLAAIYEAVYGPLPKDALGGRMWTSEAVARLSSAKALHEVGAVRSVREALERPDGLLSGEIVDLPERHDPVVLLERVLSELVELRQEVAQLKATRELPEASGMDTRRAEEAERMNRYLLGELERRRLEAEEARHDRQRWWQFWRR